jgi:probable DNA repair protein
MAHWEAHDQAMLEAGETVWETLAACSWSTFLRTMWEERLLAHRGPERLPSLMNTWQERFLWMRVLEQSPQGEMLLNMPAAGGLAAEAWGIVCAFELSAPLWNPPVPWEEETVAFLGWAQSFLDVCAQERWLDSARLEASLSEALLDGSIPSSTLPSRLTLAGFADLTPAQDRLLGACQALGVEVQLFDAQRPNTAQDWCRTVAKDGESEVRAAALWIRRILEDAGRGPVPRLALVVPNLSASRAMVTRLLDEVLQPGRLLPHRSSEESLYNLSLGLPLAGWPVVADALSLLEVEGGWQPLPNLGVLFHSPFTAGAETEQGPRALLEARLLRDGAYQVSLSRLIQRALRTDLEGAARPTTCLVLGERLQAVQERLQATSLRLAPSRWAEEFKELLELFGWPGERTLDSAEFQTVVAWMELLAHLGSLDRVYATLNRREAMMALRRMAEETVYQPKIARGPVEVLGYLEAAGLPFDHLWLVGMHDAAWPQASRPNPYLPAALQRANGVPHSSADRELEFAQRLTDQLLQGSPHGVVSCAAQDGDQPLRPSLLVAHLPERSLGLLPLATVDLLPFVIYESRQLERVVDPGPPPVAAGHTSGGGTSIFKLQAACPFRAFATLRLHARPLQSVDGGLDPAQRGKLLHHVLEGFWKRARTSKALHDWPEDLRAEVLSEAVEEALLAGKKERPDVLFGAFLDLERQRLTELTLEWLALEAQRSPFMVRDTERGVELEFGGVKLRAIIDRIDRLADGSLVVIDYKTGMVNYRDWLGERPAEPQLPLYSVASPEPAAALVFGRLRTGQMAFSGISRDSEMLPGVDPSEQAGDLGMPWADRQQQWREVLEGLAGQFHRGESKVDPLQRNKTCRNCRLETFCRVDELEARR